MEFLIFLFAIIGIVSSIVSKSKKKAAEERRRQQLQRQAVAHAYPPSSPPQQVSQQPPQYAPQPLSAQTAPQSQLQQPYAAQYVLQQPQYTLQSLTSEQPELMAFGGLFGTLANETAAWADNLAQPFVPQPSDAGQGYPKQDETGTEGECFDELHSHSAAPSKAAIPPREAAPTPAEPRVDVPCRPGVLARSRGDIINAVIWSEILTRPRERMKRRLGY